MKRIQKQRHKNRRFASKKPEFSDVSSDFEEEDSQTPYNSSSLLTQLGSPDPKQQEFATSLLANLSTEITSQQINQLFSEEILQALLQLLDFSPQTQVLLNVFSALQALVTNEDRILEKKQRKSQGNSLEKTNFLINRGLFLKIEGVMRQCLDSLRSSSLLLDKSQAKLLVLKLLGTLASFFEVLPEDLLGKHMRNLAIFVVELLLFQENDAFFLEILNILQIFVEFREFVEPKTLIISSEPAVSRLKAVFFAQTDAISQQNLELLQGKAYLLEIFAQLFEETPLFASLQQDFVKETVNFVEIVAKCPFAQDFAELGKLCEAENATKTQELLELWLKEAKIVEFSLIFLNNLLQNEQEFESCSDFEETFEEEKQEKSENAYRNALVQEIFVKKGAFFLQNTLKNLVISKENASSFEKYEKNGLQEAVSAVCYVSFLAISAINAAFLAKSAVFPLQLGEKREFFELFSAKMLDLLSFQQEIAHFPGFEDFFTRFLGVFLEFLQENREIFVETGSFARVFPVNSVISLCNLCVNIENAVNKELFAFCLEFLALRLPINLTNSQEFALKPQEVEEIVGILLKSLENRKGFVQAHALNALFDVFSDETYNLWLKNMGVIGKLESFDVSKVKKIKGRFFKDTVVNLNEFIKYKRKLGV